MSCASNRSTHHVFSFNFFQKKLFRFCNAGDVVTVQYFSGVGRVLGPKKEMRNKHTPTPLLRQPANTQSPNTRFTDS